MNQEGRDTRKVCASLLMVSRSLSTKKNFHLINAAKIILSGRRVFFMMHVMYKSIVVPESENVSLAINKKVIL